MTPLKLIALDPDDLAVVSMHLQDAVLRVADMAYLPKDRRFAALACRFDWTVAANVPAGAGPDYMRRRAALRFERVRAAQVQGVNLADKTQVLSLLAIQFEVTSAPSGYVTLVCAGGAAIRLDVECIEAEMKDLDEGWRTTRLPQHPDAARRPATTT